METMRIEARATNPARAPLHPDISEALITTLVHRFYAKVRAHERLGPIFESVIGDEWGPHLQTMVNFWSSVTRMTGRYKGKPMVAHMRLKEVRPEDFELWLALFRETARETLDDQVATIFIDRAQRIAESLKLAMFFNPAADRNARRL